MNAQPELTIMELTDSSYHPSNAELDGQSGSKGRSRT